MLQTSLTMGERKDVEIYTDAIETGLGLAPDWPERVPQEFIAYVEKGNTVYLDGKDPTPVMFNYEKWLG